ncbi:hypothetical protein CLV63_111131 [Murinocardiopsis flavida]|uniref:Rhodanese domain-containing protein n=1 Tax=Murinocardiopsis flavida TaxID=645275 RepID=A0A2P8DH58_9ACTN|nr:rhodanese-like domain-containing protein [Murinocardiopsis flavida]PSK96536.1 hypothetical protein CLV63_111131 [Murinocardiopsis flavida]
MFREEPRRGVEDCGAVACDDVDTKAPTLLPDRGAAIVTYCANPACPNPACPNSGQVADRLVRLGYTDVRKYREGIEDWTVAGLPTEPA